MRDPSPRGAPICLTWLVGAIAALAAVPALAKDVPRLSGRVNDTAQMIPPEVRDRLERRLAAFEHDTGAQIAVLTVASLDGEVLADYVIKVAQTWKLGRKGVDDGVLLLVARDDRKLRFEVGYGLEAKLTDLLCRRIEDNVILPAFRDGDFGRGIEAGVEAILGTIQGKDAIPARPRSAVEQFASDHARWLMIGSFFFVVGLFSVMAVFVAGRVSWGIFVILIPFWIAFPLVFFGLPGLSAIAAWLIGFPIARHLLHGTTAGKRFLAAHPQLTKVSVSSGDSGSDGGWSSDGGFSGSGGSFGGGGASGSW